MYLVLFLFRRRWFSADQPLTALMSSCQYNEKLTDYKGELASVYSQLIEIDIPDDHDLFHLHTALKDTLFQCSLKIKTLQYARLTAPSPVPPTPTSTVRLPKLEVPTFDGNIYFGKSFGNSFLFLYITTPTYLMPKSWCTYNKPSRIAPQAPLLRVYQRLEINTRKQ